MVLRRLPPGLVLVPQTERARVVDIGVNEGPGPVSVSQPQLNQPINGVFTLASPLHSTLILILTLILTLTLTLAHRSCSSIRVNGFWISRTRS